MNPTRKRPGPPVVLGLLALLASWPLLAGSAGVEHPLRKDYAMEWAGRLSLFGVIGAIALIAYVLLFRRRSIAAAPSQWILFIGICVMPLPVMLLGSAVGLERAKAVSFCQHCHVMRPFVGDMKDPGSRTLAALHFRNRYIQRDNCYVCHTDYGLFGTMEAKFAGILHIWRESTGSFTLPVKISHPYRYLICLDCHAGSAKYERLREHAGLAAATERGEATCAGCHGLAHVAREKRGGA